MVFTKIKFGTFGAGSVLSFGTFGAGSILSHWRMYEN